MLKKLIVTNVTCHKCHILSQPKSVRSQLLQCKTNCSFVCLFAIMFVLTQRRRERRVPTENYVSRRTVFVPLIMIFCPAEMAEMAEIFPLFRYFSVSSVIDKDNSHGDWREDIFYNGSNGNYRKRRTSENRVILV